MRKGSKQRVGQSIAVVVALAVLLGVSGCSLLTPSVQQARDDHQRQATVDDELLHTPGVLTVGLDSADVPQVLTSQDGSMSGYEADLARAIAAQMGLTVAFVDTPSAHTAFTTAGADIFLGASASEATKDASVVGTCLQDAPALFSQGMTISSVSDLAGLKIAVQDSSAAQDALASIGYGSQSVTYSNVNECFEALKKGEADVVACDATAGAYLARAYKGVSFAGSLGSTSSYGVAVSPTATGLRKAVSEAFSQIQSDGRLDAVHCAWYGSLPVDLSQTLLSGITVTTSDEQGSSSDTQDSSSDDQDTTESSSQSSSSTLDDINNFQG